MCCRSPCPSGLLYRPVTAPSRRKTFLPRPLAPAPPQGQTPGHVAPQGSAPIFRNREVGESYFLPVSPTTFYVTSCARNWSPAVPTEIWRLQLGSGSAHHLDLAVAVEAVPTEIWRLQFGSGTPITEIWRSQLRQCLLRSRACSWGPAAPTTEIWRSQLRQCPLRSGACSSGPAAPITEIWRSQLRQCLLRSRACSWGPAAPTTEIWRSQLRQCLLRSRACSWGPAAPITEIWRSQLRQCQLKSGACSWGPIPSPSTLSSLKCRSLPTELSPCYFP